MENQHQTKKKYHKIAFIAGTLGKGGAERQLYYLADSLVKSGYDVKVYCLTIGEFYESKLRMDGIEVIYFGAEKSKIKRTYSLCRLLRKSPPQLIYSFHFYTNTYAGLAGKFLGLKTVGSIRNDAISEKEANGKISWLHFSLPGFIIANSLHGALNSKKIFFKKKVFVLNNVIDTDAFQFAEKEISPVNPIILLLVGRLEEQKQPWLFPLLIKKLSDSDIWVEGHMFGAGTLRDKTKDLLAKNFPRYNISMHDIHPNIQEVYKNAHWLCSLSKHEGTPNVVMEAMASGVGIAALNYPGIAKLISNKSDGLVEESIETLGNSIIENSNAIVYKKITQRAREKIVKDYSVVHLVEKFEEILDKL